MNGSRCSRPLVPGFPWPQKTAAHLQSLPFQTHPKKSTKPGPALTPNFLGALPLRSPSQEPRSGLSPPEPLAPP